MCCNDYSGDSAVYNLTANVSEAINLTIRSVKPKNSNFFHWFYKSLIYYIKKRSQFLKTFKKSKSDRHYRTVLYYRKLVKTAISAVGWIG
jgi:hypothetical protein